MKRPATRVVQIVKHEGAFSTDDIISIFTNVAEWEKDPRVIGVMRSMANTMTEIVQQGKFDLRKM